MTPFKALSFLLVVVLLISLSIASALLVVGPSPSSSCSARRTATLRMASDRCERNSAAAAVANPPPSRRAFLSRAAAAAAAIATAPTRPASATIMDSNLEATKTFKPGEKLGVDAAKERFALARNDVKYLLDNWDDVCRGGGDAVRRYLGTVGVSSYMYGIAKVMTELKDEADDLVEYTEAMNEFNAYLSQAEGAAYSSLFVEHSSAKGTPESWLRTAREDVRQMARYMDELAVQLKL